MNFTLYVALTMILKPNLLSRCKNNSLKTFSVDARISDENMFLQYKTKPERNLPVHFSCLCVYPSVCPSVCLLVCLSLFLSVCLSIFLFVCFLVWWFVCWFFKRYFRLVLFFVLLFGFFSSCLLVIFFFLRFLSLLVRILQSVERSFPKVTSGMI